MSFRYEKGIIKYGCLQNPSHSGYKIKILVHRKTNTVQRMGDGLDAGVGHLAKWFCCSMLKYQQWGE